MQLPLWSKMDVVDGVARNGSGINDVDVRHLCRGATVGRPHIADALVASLFVEVTPALRGYVTQKLDRIMRHFDQVVDVRVLLTIENQKEKEGRQRAECNIHVKGNDLFAESSSEDLYAAVDELVDKFALAVQDVVPG